MLTYLVNERDLSGKIYIDSNNERFVFDVSNLIENTYCVKTQDLENLYEYIYFDARNMDDLKTECKKYIESHGRKVKNIEFKLKGR